MTDLKYDVTWPFPGGFGGFGRTPPVGPHLRSQRKSDPIGIFMRPYGSDISGVIRNMRTRFLSMRSVIIEAYLTCLLCP